MKSLAPLLAFLFSAGSRIHAASLSTGTALMDFDRTAWDALAAEIGLPTPVLTLDSFFDADGATARNYNQILRDPSTNAIYTGQVYRMNGSTVTNLEGRTSQPTTFFFTPGNPSQHTGAIGLAGIARFAVSGGGSLLYGDYTLQYDAARIARGGTGWYLKGNIPPVAPAFDLLQVALEETASTLRLTGDLAVTFELAHFLYSTPADALRVVGTFEFTAGIAGVATPPALREFRVVDGSLILLGTGSPGGSYTLETATNLELPALSWSPAVTGTFDALGNSSNSLPVLPADSVRWFRLQQP
ncbi:MAG: hypothetical protein J0M24_19135 [Verrucomicrobia bacterium]|nr:hypothetical protein [Verrucomicrobiota bacterium]